MKKNLLFLLVGTLFIISASYANLKIAVVDLHKVLQNDPQVGILQTQIKKQFLPDGKAIIAANKKLQKDVQKLRSNQKTNSNKEYQKLQQQIIADHRKLHNMQAIFQQNLITAQDKALQQITTSVMQIIKQTAQKNQLDIVLLKRNVLYNCPTTDITQQISSKVKK